MTLTPEQRALIEKVRDNPSDHTKTYLRDNPYEDAENEWHRECIFAVAMMVEEGQLFYDTRTKRLIKPYSTKQ